MAKNIVFVFTYVKNILGVQTYILESIFVLLILILTALLAGKDWLEWIAVLAVFFTFSHASVANRMEEKEELKAKKGQKIDVSCYKMSSRYFFLKESLWFLYFFLAGSYSALAGVIVFLFYGWWRKTYRTYNKLK